MDAVNPFAQMPPTPEPIIAQVRKALLRDETIRPQVNTSDLDRIVETAVTDLWGCRVRTFVPILALRQAREALQIAGFATAQPALAARAGDESVSGRLLRETVPVNRDVLMHLPSDRFRLDE